MILQLNRFQFGHGENDGFDGSEYAHALHLGHEVLGFARYFDLVKVHNIERNVFHV